jgi:hypothetical protein
MSAKKNPPSEAQERGAEASEEAESGLLPGAGKHFPDDLRLGGHGKDGDVLLLNASNHQTVHLDGKSGSLELGGHDVDGDVRLSDGHGNETIHLDGKRGEIRIRDWRLRVPDYVFETGYALRSMHDVQTFIEAHGHLPDVPCAREVQRDGVDVASFAMTLLQKVEELTLYALEQSRALEAQSQRIAALERELRGQGPC